MKQFLKRLALIAVSAAMVSTCAFADTATPTSTPASTGSDISVSYDKDYMTVTINSIGYDEEFSEICDFTKGFTNGAMPGDSFTGGMIIINNSNKKITLKSVATQTSLVLNDKYYTRYSKGKTREELAKYFFDECFIINRVGFNKVDFESMFGVFSTLEAGKTYSFDGNAMDVTLDWAKTTNVYQSATIGASAKLIFRSEEQPPHPVSYSYTNTPAGVPALPETLNYKEGAPVALAVAPSYNGLTFSGWKMKKDGSNAADFTMPGEAVELEGTWYVALNYNANGGTGSNASVKDEFGKAVSVLADSGNVTRTDYTFVGWNTQADGNGTFVTGKALTLPTETTVYAIWEANPVTPPVTPPVVPNNPGDSDEPDYPANPVIPNQPVPLNPTPGNPSNPTTPGNTVTINPNRTALAATPNTVTILDPNVALGALPKSGSSYGVMVALGSALLLGSCAVTFRKNKKKDQDK